MLYYTDPNGVSHQFKNSGEMNQFLEINFPETILTEEAVIIDRNNNFSINVTPDSTRNLGIGGGYFKWLDSASYSKAKKIARIMFAQPVYIKGHTDGTGKIETTLSSKEKKEMMKAFMKPIDRKHKDSLGRDGFDPRLIARIENVWQYSILKYNKEADVPVAHINAFYTDGYFEQMSSNFIPIDLPIPDYKLLP